MSGDRASANGSRPSRVEEAMRPLEIDRDQAKISLIEYVEQPAVRIERQVAGKAIGEAILVRLENAFIAAVKCIDRAHTALNCRPTRRACARHRKPGP